MDGAGDSGVFGVFRVVFEERVQYGHQIAAVQELDISVGAGDRQGAKGKRVYKEI